MNTSYRVYFLAELTEALKSIVALIFRLAIVVGILLSLSTLAKQTNLTVVLGVLVIAAFLLIVAARANHKYSRDRRRRELN